MQNLKSGFQCAKNKEISLQNISEVVFFGDVGCTTFTETSKKVLSEILSIKTDLFVVLGDISFLGDKEPFEEVVDFCDQRVNAPIFALCGNHDVPGFSQVLGRTTCALILDKFVIVLLDNSYSKFSEESLDLLKEMLAKYSEKRFLITFHVPPPTDLGPGAMKKDEWEKIKSVMDEYRDKIDYIFCAHLHGFQEYEIDGYRIFITGGGGAALYSFKKDTLNSHHAIKVSFKENEELSIDVIPVKV